MNARYYVPGVGRFASADSLVPNSADPQSFNRYSYVYNNPLNATDPSGHFFETVWDAANIVVGAGSLGYNLWHHNWGDAAWDAGGLLLDVGATAIPFVPGGAATAIKVGRSADNVVDAVNAIDNVTDAVRAVENSADVVNSTDNLADLGNHLNDTDNGLTRVGRWMNKEEHELMLETNRVIESNSSQTSILYKNNPDGFERQAIPYSRYVEFNIPKNSYRITNEPLGWGVINGPNSVVGRLAQRTGRIVPEMPPAYNILWTRSRIP